MADEKTGVLPKEDVTDSVRAAVAEVAKAKGEATEIEQAPAPQVEAEPKEPKAVDDRPRGPDGKFVKVEADKPAPAAPAAKEVPATDGAPAQAGAPQVIEAPTPAAGAPPAPPPGFSIKTKADWDRIAKEFPHLAADIAKREAEVSNGFKQYEGLRPFADRAQKSGQSLAGVVQRFVQFEDTLRQNPEQGFTHIAQNLGLTQHQFGQLCLKLAQAHGAVPDQQGYQPQQDQYAAPSNGTAFDPNALAPILQPMMQKFGTLEQTLNQIVSERTAHQQATVDSAITEFGSDPAHRYFANVEDRIAELFEKGLVQRSGNPKADLAKAYEIACWENPEIREQLINERVQASAGSQKQRDIEIAEKARKAGKSISGAPPAGVIGATQGDNLEDVVRAAVRQHS